MSQVVQKDFVSAIVRNKSKPESVLEQVNKNISSMCKNNNFIFVNNSNISNIYLFNDDLHLVESCRCILENNVIDSLNNFLLTQLHHTNIHTYHAVINRSSLRDVYHNNMQSLGLQILHKIKLKYPMNPFVGYLNINSFSNELLMSEK